jgi:undecaprenyl-diphosphatase
VAIVALIALVAWRAIGPAGLLLAAAPLVAVAAASALKPLFGPSEVEERFRWPVDTYPSGHAAFAAAAAAAGAWLALRSGRRGLAIAFAIVVAAAGVGQVVQSAHWPSDVVGGWTLGAACALGGVYAVGVTR